jgi:hypothetical protein
LFGLPDPVKTGQPSMNKCIVIRTPENQMVKLRLTLRKMPLAEIWRFSYSNDSLKAKLAEQKGLKLPHFVRDYFFSKEAALERLEKHNNQAK